MVGMGIAAVCATGCGSATLLHDGGAAAGGNGTGGQGGTAGHAPTGTGGTAGGGQIGTAGTIGSGGTAGATGTVGMAGATGSGGGGASGTGMKATGSTCSASDQCSSANCRDSICCPASCTLSCQGCASSVTGSADGTCALRTSNPAGTQICSSQCVNVSGTDAGNCGSCGHGCLGGTCSAGACQPVELGTVPSPLQSAGLLVLSGGYLYSTTIEVVQAGIYPQIYQFNPNAPSTGPGALVASETTSNGPPQCVMDGKLFWAAGGGQFQSTPIKVCTLGNCAATTTTLLTSPGQVYGNPFCDTTTDEIVWDDYTSAGPGSTVMIVTIYRAASNGTNMRSMTFYQAPTGGDGINFYSDLGIPSGASDRWYLTTTVSSTQTTTLYYVLTNSAGVSPVSIGTGTINVTNHSTNDTLYVWTDGSGSPSYDVPLPNGVTGMPPVFYAGALDGVMDNQTFYGTFSGLPADAIGKCPLSNCSNPTTMFRGQQGANSFTQDATALYWTTSVTNNGYTVWKGAK